MKLRLAGASYAAIADKLDCSKSQAHRDVKDALDEIKREPAQQVLDMELQRLDQMLLGLYKPSVSGDVKAVLATLRIMDRRARYLGLDKVTPTDSAEEARQALAALHAAILARADEIDPDPTFGQAEQDSDSDDGEEGS